MLLMELSKDRVISYLHALLSSCLDNADNANSSCNTTSSVFKQNKERLLLVKYYLQKLLEEPDTNFAAARNIIHNTKENGRYKNLAWRIWGMKAGTSTITKIHQEVQATRETQEIIEEECPLPEWEMESAFFHCNDAVEEDAISIISADELEYSAMGNDRFPKLYCVLISLHGLIRGTNMELGRDSDTGGQVKYVVELTKALSKHPAVHRVDLITRYIDDPSIDNTYANIEEPLHTHDGTKHGGGFIVRLPCGPNDRYLPKEKLWPYIREFADNAIHYIKSKLGNMLQDGEVSELYAVHGHYADAGEAATIIGNVLGVDVIFTGHSLGRNKLEHLLQSGLLTKRDIENKYNISRRIEAEERILDNAALIFSSTQQEVQEQWGLYNGINLQVEHVPSARHFPHMITIPPGVDFKKRQEREECDEPSIWKELRRFLANPHKPAILVLCRPNTTKNVLKVLEVYGKSKMLQDLANVVLVLGNRENIDDMAGESKAILNEVLKAIDKYNLYGSVAFPKKHEQNEVSDIYGFAYHTRGLFMNIALHEAFGLTLIEASAQGLPLIATCNGGPTEIIGRLQNGILVDPKDNEQIHNAIFEILTNSKTWEEFSKNGLAATQEYSWRAHCDRYLASVDTYKKDFAFQRSKLLLNSCMDDMFLNVRKRIPELDAFIKEYFKSKHRMLDVQKGYQVYLLNDVGDLETICRTDNIEPNATGLLSLYDLETTLSMLGGRFLPSFLICICGAEVWYYNSGQDKYILDNQFNNFIDHYWDKQTVLRLLMTFIKERNLRHHVVVNAKVSHHRILVKMLSTSHNVNSLITALQTRFRRSGIRVNIVASFHDKEMNLNIIPIKASRSLALKYVAHKHGIEDITLHCNVIAGRTENEMILPTNDVEELIEGNYKVIAYPRATGVGHVYNLCDNMNTQKIMFIKKYDH